MYRKLYRSTQEKMIGGVAGGIAEYFEIDPTLVRVLFIISLFLGGSGVLAYIILWIVVPAAPYINADTENSTAHNQENNSSQNENQSSSNQFEETSKHRRTNTAGILLIVIGLIFLADNLFPMLDFDKFWPLILIAIGVGLLLNWKK